MAKYGKGPYGEARMAACHDHKYMIVDAFDGGIVEIRRVHDDPHYKCSCGRPADFFALEVLEDE